METNDFLGSFAQENVSFNVQIVRTASVGDNYWTVMVFVESDRFVQATEANGWEDAPNLPGCKVLVVTADTYSQFTSGLLASWLYDLFINGFTGNCILVAPAASTAAPVYTYSQVTPAGTENPSEQGWYEQNAEGTYVATTDSTVTAGKIYYSRTETPGFVDAMNKAYDVLKPYAYHKTVCAGAADSVTPAYAVALATKCAEDTYLSAPPCLPVTDPTLTSDPLYSALIGGGTRTDAFMGWHSDTTRNLALYSLGLALGFINGSGTPVGNVMDMTASGNITASAGGLNPSVGQKALLKGKYVQYMKTVGDNTGSVAAETDKTIAGQVYAANWILAYITYMVRVGVAKIITQRNFFRNEYNYKQITGVLERYVNQMGSSGVLTDITFTYPSFGALPETSEEEYVIPNAWSARYVNHTKKVTITGTLYIGS